MNYHSITKKIYNKAIPEKIQIYSEIIYFLEKIKRKMPKLNAVLDTEKVSEYIQKIQSPTKEIVEFIRQIILNTDNEISEQIKWNSPSFYYSGEMQAFDAKEYKRDILVMNLHRGNILLVLPTGAKINDNSGILEGNYTDGRKLIKIKDLEDAKSKEDSLRQALKDWLRQVDK